MWRIPATVATALLATTIAVPATSSAQESPPPAIRLVDMRRVELPGVRILSMSPDGSSIVGVRPAVGYARGELCTFAVDTLAVRACASIADLGSSLRLEDVTWSPDGSMVAFTANAFQTLRDGDLWLMDAATGAIRDLDDDGFTGSLPFGDDQAEGVITVPVAPAFTPDGGAVSYSRSTWRDGVPEGTDIATVPVTGGDPARLVAVSDEVGAVYFGMRWSPDGSTLVYSRSEMDPRDPANGIWSVAADGSGARLLAGTTDPRLSAPAVAAVSPAGDRLLAWYPISATEMTAPYALSLMDIATGSETPLTIDDRAPAAVQMATFAPDGTMLLEVTRYTQPDHQVRVRDLVEGSTTTLVAGDIEMAGPPQYGIMPTWARNGTVLVTGGGDLSGATLLTLDAGLPGR